MMYYHRRNYSSTSAPTSLSDATSSSIDSSSFPKPSSSANNDPTAENNHATIMNASNNNNNNSILDSNVIQTIIQDLKDADINNDKKVCYEELKLILSKYPNIFTPKDIDYISELFYVGKSGNSVPHTTFIRSLQYINQNNNSTYYTNDTNSTTTSSHLQKSTESDVEKSDIDTSARDQTSALLLQQRKNPLQLEQLDDNRCWVTTDQNVDNDPTLPYFNTQTEFEQQLLKYLQEVIQRTRATSKSTSSLSPSYSSQNQDDETGQEMSTTVTTTSLSSATTTSSPS